jgi:hypothetical protein
MFENLIRKAGRQEKANEQKHFPARFLFLNSCFPYSKISPARRRTAQGRTACGWKPGCRPRRPVYFIKTPAGQTGK